ncbi:hypothetical protein [Bdellovibrio sp. NC01]|uniref:hypothetical protein n=1 Tax=Bdellovibrio sp. NC01 TaxID=2220073 RepID=UPI001FEEBD32|nr:hypothetical protein [Bdellovibrio sp. NC01]
MILLWLGSFVLMMMGLSQSQKYAGELFANLQKKFLSKGLESDFKSMLIRSLDVAILEASPQKSLYAGMALYNLRIVGVRPSVLIMCLSTLSAWWMLILGFLYMSFNGLFLMGLCSVFLLTPFITPKLDKVLKWIFFTGLFLLGGEVLLRNSSVVQSTFGMESEFIFFLADGRFQSVLAILAAAIVVSLFVQVEFWSMALGLSLLFTNFISFNGALALLAGERIGRMILFWWHTRSLNQDCRKLGAQFAVVSAVGAIVGFLVAGEIRHGMLLGYSNDTGGFQDKSLQFMILFIGILFFQFIAQMIWGHFAGNSKLEEIQDAKYISNVWFRNEFKSVGVMSWAKDKVHKRLSEVRYHVQGLGTFKEGQVPDHIQARVRSEEEQLQRIEKLLV